MARQVSWSREHEMITLRINDYEVLIPVIHDHGATYHDKVWNRATAVKAHLDRALPQFGLECKLIERRTDK